MRCSSALAVLSPVLLVSALTHSSTIAQETPAPGVPLIGPIPEIQLSDEKWSATEDEQAQVAELIDSLAEIENPDYGFAPFMSGAQFAPVSDSSSFGPGIIMINHGLKTDESLRRLVALGPKALPQLLNRLSDETPTRLVMRHGGGFGGQWYGREVALNLAGKAEREAWTRLRESAPKDRFEEDVRTHQITIGDVCFVIIGQIVNRGYQSARYQPTACRVINSPTHDPLIADIVRGIWTSEAPAQQLLDSLLIDLNTKDTIHLQCGAAMRLLYYFPDQTAELIAARITGFDLREPTEDNDWRMIYEKNGLRTADFIKAVRASSHPAIIEALLHVVRQTDDPDNLHAAVTAGVVERAPDLVFDRMKQVVSTPPPPDQGPFSAEHNTLRAAAAYFPEKSRELFEIYRSYNSPAALRTTIHALDEPADRRDWMTAFLATLLDDKTDTGWEYGPDFDRQPIRICDEAAKVLADNYLDAVRFEYEKKPAHLDEQIEKIKRVISGESGVSFDPPERLVIPDDVPRRTPLHVVELDRSIRLIHPFSTRESIWLCGAYGGSKRYAWSLKLNAETGEVLKETPRAEGLGRVSLLDNAPPDRAYIYHGDERGHVSIHEARTGREIATITTPFHDGVQFNDPLQVRNLGDITVCGVDAEWIIAVTDDGALHSVDVASGEHRVEWREKSENPEVLGIQGTSRVLLEGVGGESLFDVPVQMWDQATKTRHTIEKVPFAGWHAAWGDLAWNRFCGISTLWNLAKSQQLVILEGEFPVASVACNSDQSRVFALRSDGSIDVFSVTDGIALAPLLHLLPPTEEDMEVSIVPGTDDRLLFWTGRPPTRTDDEGHRIREDRTVIAVFDYGESAANP